MVVALYRRLFRRSTIPTPASKICRDTGAPSYGFSRLNRLISSTSRTVPGAILLCSISFRNAASLPVLAFLPRKALTPASWNVNAPSSYSGWGLEPGCDHGVLPTLGVALGLLRSREAGVRAGGACHRSASAFSTCSRYNRKASSRRAPVGAPFNVRDTRLLTGPYEPAWA
jgi:hypothetical protein